MKKNEKIMKDIISSFRNIMIVLSISFIGVIWALGIVGTVIMLGWAGVELGIILIWIGLLMYFYAALIFPIMKGEETEDLTEVKGGNAK